MSDKFSLSSQILLLVTSFQAFFPLAGIANDIFSDWSPGEFRNSSTFALIEKLHGGASPQEKQSLPSEQYENWKIFLKHCNAGHVDFSKEAWASASGYSRLNTLEDLLSSRKIIGMKRSQLHDLLNKPNTVDQSTINNRLDKNHSIEWYQLAYGSSFCGNFYRQTPFLEIAFANDRVRGFRIGRPLFAFPSAVLLNLPQLAPNPDGTTGGALLEKKGIL